MSPPGDPQGPQSPTLGPASPSCPGKPRLPGAPCGGRWGFVGSGEAFRVDGRILGIGVRSLGSGLFLGVGVRFLLQGQFFGIGVNFLGIRVGFWGRGHHRPSLQAAPKVRQLQVLRGLLSSLLPPPVRGHLGVLQGPEEEVEKGSQGAFILSPTTPGTDPMKPNPPEDKSHKSQSPSCPARVPAGAGARRGPIDGG